jgi:uncharacterized repeat protein (TIGR03803 family)
MIRSKRFCMPQALVMIAAVVSGCNGALPAASTAIAPNILVEGHSEGVRVLHAFTNNPDGAYPVAGLTRLAGYLYGTTYNGGSTGGGGVIYRLSVTGQETVLTSFVIEDAQEPNGELLAYGGKLYGTTLYGGTAHDAGTAYVVTTSGDVRILHTFLDGADGGKPYAGLIEVNGKLYGTAASGGAQNLGAVFSIDPVSGKEKTIYSFGSQPTDGAGPCSTLTLWQGKLFGTTRGGGEYGGNGTVFSVTLKGKEAILHAFGAANDGKDPYFSALTPLGGFLYGTTSLGGTRGSGNVFKIDSSGRERTVYNFGDNKADGNAPAAGVVLYHNALYGTTSAGGTTGRGTIFRVTVGGRESVLHAFSANEGSSSLSRILIDGTLFYGTMEVGGSSGFGSAYRFAP